MTVLLKVFLAIISSGFVINLLPGHIIHMLVSENGLFENVQVVLYVAGAIISLIYAKRKIWRDGLNGGIILMLFALRELDFQKKFTSISITRTKFYFSSDIALYTKIFYGLIVLWILITIILFIKNNSAALISGLRNHNIWAISAAVGVILIPVALAIDSSLRFLKSVGFNIDNNAHIIKTVFEEVTELAIPAMFLIALLQFGKGVMDKIPDITHE